MAEKKPKPKKEKVIITEKPKDIYDALFAFKKEEIVIPRRGEGKIKDGRVYKYATLDDTMLAINPFLIKHDLLVIQPPSNMKLETIIRHVPSGTDIKSDIELGKPESSQDLGARITYFRRYMISSMLGLVIEEDTDANPVKTTEKPAETVTPPFQRPPATGEQTVVQVQPQSEPKVKRSPAYEKASQAILSCENPAALEALQRAIDASVRLNDGEKADLKVELDAKMNEIEPTIKRD